MVLNIISAFYFNQALNSTENYLYLNNKDFEFEQKEKTFLGYN
jgi:hypothetical protein